MGVGRSGGWHLTGKINVLVMFPFFDYSWHKSHLCIYASICDASSSDPRKAFSTRKTDDGYKSLVRFKLVHLVVWNFLANDDQSVRSWPVFRAARVFVELYNNNTIIMFYKLLKCNFTFVFSSMSRSSVPSFSFTNCLYNYMYYTPFEFLSCTENLLLSFFGNWYFWYF